MFEKLKSYPHKGCFEFTPQDRLSSVCTAPTDKSGVYIVWDYSNREKPVLLYIGRSGKMENGVIVHRKAGLGGMKDRLVNGHQFGREPRKRIWPIIMQQSGISRLAVSWFDTEDDDPVEIERQLLAWFQTQFGCLPRWNKQSY